MLPSRTSAISVEDREVHCLCTSFLSLPHQAPQILDIILHFNATPALKFSAVAKRAPRAIPIFEHLSSYIRTLSEPTAAMSNKQGKMVCHVAAPACALPMRNTERILTSFFSSLGRLRTLPPSPSRPGPSSLAVDR